MSAAEIIDDCAAGRLPPQIALMHLAAGAASEAEFAAALELARGRAGEPALARLCALAARSGSAWRLTHDLLGAVDHAGARSVDEFASMFDAAVAVSPAGSVALYSLGDEEELAGATAEIVALLERERLVGAESDILDLGCGIGRLVQALAPRVRSVVGLDISAGMIAEASRRCAGLRNVRLALSSGRDLAPLADGSVDLVLAADVFPYLVQVGLDLVATHLCEATRVLRPGGALLILNFSYRGDAARDARDLAALRERAGLVAEPAPRTRFDRWDAAAFLLRKPA